MGSLFGGGSSTPTYIPAPSTTAVETTQAKDPTQADASENDVDNRAKALAAAGEEDINTSPLGDINEPVVKKKQLGSF